MSVDGPFRWPAPGEADAIPVPPAAAAITPAAQMPSAHVFFMFLPLWPASAVCGGLSTTLGTTAKSLKVPTVHIPTPEIMTGVTTSQPDSGCHLDKCVVIICNMDLADAGIYSR